LFRDFDPFSNSGAGGFGAGRGFAESYDGFNAAQEAAGSVPLKKDAIFIIIYLN
jgi:hypothetical protein